MSSRAMSISYWQNRCSSSCLKTKTDGKIQGGYNRSLHELGRISRSLQSSHRTWVMSFTRKLETVSTKQHLSQAVVFAVPCVWFHVAHFKAAHTLHQYLVFLFIFFPREHFFYSTLSFFFYYYLFRHQGYYLKIFLQISTLQIFG